MMKSDAARRRILKQGWLKKQGGMVKTWHWRWFILNGDCLFYFAKEDDVKILGSIYLLGNRIIEHPFRPEDPDKFLFEILPAKGQNKMSANHESFLLSGASVIDRQEWMAVIRKVMYATIGGAIFGQKLEETMAYEKKRGNDIPFIVEQTVQYILSYGLDTEGILRLAGRAALLRELKEAFDTGQQITFTPDVHDVHTVASLLKAYFRELPESIVPCDFYQKFMNHALRYQDTKLFEEVENLKKSIEKLPDDNYRILAYICQFLHKIGQNSDVNKMNNWNLATVFGPNIIRHMDDNPTLFMATADLTQVLGNMLIENCDFLFPEERLGKSPIRTAAERVPVDDLLRMSVVGMDSEYEMLEPVSSNRAGLDLDTTREHLRKSLSLPSEGSSSRSSASKRHGLELNLKGNPMGCSMGNSSLPCSPLDDEDNPIPALRRSRKNRVPKVVSDDGGAVEHQRNSEVVPASSSALSCDPSLSVVTSNLLNGNPSQVDGGQESLNKQIDTLPFNEQNEILKMDLLNQKNEYVEKMKLMAEKHSLEINKLLIKLNEERESKSVAIDKVVSLQRELTRYQIKYGELDPL